MHLTRAAVRLSGRHGSDFVGHIYLTFGGARSSESEVQLEVVEPGDVRVDVLFFQALG